MQVGIIAWPKWTEKILWIPSMTNGSSVITPTQYYVVFLFSFLYFLQVTTLARDVSQERNAVFLFSLPLQSCWKKEGRK